MFNRFFNSQTNSVGAAAGILALSALISRVLGMVRDWLLAKTFGAGPELDVYFAAFRIPDLVYNILIAGGVIVAFLPLFSEYFSKEKKEDAWRFTNNTLNIFLFLLIFLCLILFIFASPLIKLITPGFNPEQLQKTIFLTRLMFLSPIFLGLSSIFSGILQYFNRFLIYGLCPILYNLGIIFGILFLASPLGVLGVAIGVILGAFFHFAIQIPSATASGFRYKPIFDFGDLGIKRVFLLMIPRTFGVASQQVNLLFITAIASTLGAGALSIFNFANNIQYLPIGIIGVSFAVAAFPRLSKTWAENEKGKFLSNFSSVFRQTLFLIIPISILTYLLRNQIVGIILRHGEFSFKAAELTAASIGLFCFGIFAQSLIPLIFRAFFSFQDTKTPTLISIAGMTLNVILSFYFTWLLDPARMLSASYGVNFSNIIVNIFSLQGIENVQILGLPLAFTIAGIFQFILLMVFLYRKIGDYRLREIFNSFLKILIASLSMAVLVYLTLYLVSLSLDTQTFWGIFWQTTITGLVGVLVYLIATFLLKSPEIEIIKSSMSRKFRK